MNDSNNNIIASQNYNPEYLKFVTDNCNNISDYYNAYERLSTINNNISDILKIQNMVIELNSKPLFHIDIDYSKLFEADYDIYIDDTIDELSFHISQVTGWNPLNIKSLIIGTISACQQGRTITYIDDEWKEHVNLYFDVIAEAGTLKSKICEMLRSPIDKFENYLKKEGNNLSLKLLTKLSEKSLASNIKTLLDKNLDKDGFINHDSLIDDLKKYQEKFEDLTSKCKIVSSRFVVNNITVKAAYDFMASNGGVLLFFQPEGDKLLKDLEKPNGFDTILLKGYDGESIKDHVYGRERSIDYSSVNIIIFSHPQASIKFYDNKNCIDNGICERFIPIIINKNEQPKEHYNPSIMDYYDNKIRVILSNFYEMRKNAKFLELRLDDNAQQYIRMIRNIEPNLNSYFKDGYAAYLRKKAGRIVRIASCIHIWKNLYMNRNLIPIETIKVAESLMNYLESNAIAMYTKNGYSAKMDAHKILDYVIKKRLLSFEARDIQQNTRIGPIDKVHNALDVLEERNYLIQVIKPNKSRRCLMRLDLFKS